MSSVTRRESFRGVKKKKKKKRKKEKKKNSKNVLYYNRGVITLDLPSRAITFQRKFPA